MELVAELRITIGCNPSGSSIAHYKVPRYIKFTDTFPMTITGKIQKFKMREQSIEELGLGEAAHVRSA